MDELERRLRGEHEAMRDAAPQSGPAVYGAVRAGAKRRRTVRAMLTASVAVVAVGVVGVGAWGLMGDTRAQEPALPDASPTVAASSAPEPSPTVSAPTAAPAGPADPRFDDSSDGIASDAYPALAADRGYLVEPGYRYEGHEGEAYPAAHVMEDWVWDAVGIDWGLFVAAARWDISYIDDPLPQAVLYLVSPEDVYFELFELPARAWGSARATSWREDQGTATIWWREIDGEVDRGAGAVVDLRTGDVNDLVMSVYGETADDYRFVMANAAGDELWRAESDAGFKYYRWSDGADEDGWVATALVDQEPTADDAVEEIGMDTFTTTVDGDRVLLRRLDEAPSSTMTLLTYDLAFDHVSEFTFADAGGDTEFMSAAFDGSDTVVGWMSSVADPDAGETEGYNARLQLTSPGQLTRLGEDEPWGVDYGPGPWDVLYGRATPLDANVEYCGC